MNKMNNRMAIMAVALATCFPHFAAAQGAAPAAGTGSAPAGTSTGTLTASTNSSLLASESISYGNGEAIASVQVYAAQLRWTGDRNASVFKDTVVEGLRFDASVAVNSPTPQTYTSAELTNPFSGLISGYWSPIVTPNSVIVDHGLTGKSVATDRYFPLLSSDVNILKELYVSNGFGGQAVQTNQKDLTIAPMFTAYAGVGLFAELPAIISDPITAATKAVTTGSALNYMNIEGFIAGHISNKSSLDRALNVNDVGTIFSTYGIKGSVSIAGVFAFNVSYGAGIGGARHYINQTTTFSLSFSH